MQTYNRVVLDAVAMTADRDSDAISVDQLVAGSIQAVWTGTPVGDIIVQVSNDLSSPTNWTAKSTQAAGGAAGDHMFELADMGYKWVRVIYDFGSGTGTLTATAMFKGP